MLEIEVKIKLERSKAESVLQGLGFVQKDELYERDVYYNSEVKDLRGEDKALRIRETRNRITGETAVLMTYKGPKIDDSTMTREETEFPLPSFEKGDRLLQGLGFIPAGIVEKERKCYRKENVECCLDTVTGLGEYMEIEIMAEKEDDYPSAVERIDELLAVVGITRADTIRTSYLTMLERKGIWQN